MVVRFEVDACLPTTPSHRKTLPSVARPTLRFPHVAVIQAGSHVPQSHLIELKAYSGSKKHWTRSYIQLFLSQTPHIYYGAHKNGNFSEIKKFTLGEPHLDSIDQNAQPGLKETQAGTRCHPRVGREARAGRTDKPRL